MNRPGPFLFRIYLGFLLAAALLVPAPIEAQQPKTPLWAYAFDLSCRKFGELEFTKDTKKFGFEVFKDPNTGYGVYINQDGNVGGVSNFNDVSPPVKDSKAPTWTAGLDLKARKAGELEFSDKTKTYSLEVFFDTNTSNWVYICENGNIAVAPGKNTTPQNLKSPRWLHSFDLKCRKGGQKEWDKDTAIYGLEVYQDLNNSNLIYITNTGNISVVPWAEEISKSEGKNPDWLHGQDLQSRKYKEANFTDKTKKYGVEIFRDGNNSNLIFLAETGHIAVARGDKDVKAPTPKPKDAKFLHGLDLSCRNAGQENFTPDTPTFAIEIYDESNANVTLYLSQTGALSAVNKK